MIRSFNLFVMIFAFFLFAVLFNCWIVESQASDRFVVQGEETVVDSKTGLMWAIGDNGADISWQEAEAYCNNFKGGGHTDWRLPTLNELYTIFDANPDKRFKTFDPITLTACCPWTSDSRGARARTLFFITGERNIFKKTTTNDMRALPVRNVK